MHLFVVCQHIVIIVCIDTINRHYFNLYQFTKTWYHYDSEKSQWQDEETGTLVLTINTSSADRYTIKDKDDNKLVFDASGKLTKMQDASGNTLTVTYNGIRVTKVTDGTGRAAPPSQTGKDGKRPSASTPSGALCLPMTAWAARYPPGTCRGTAGATGWEPVQRCRRRWCSC